jgi:hypothetical protein
MIHIYLLFRTLFHISLLCAEKEVACFKSPRLIQGIGKRPSKNMNEKNTPRDCSRSAIIVFRLYFEILPISELSVIRYRVRCVG